jgi:uncharacterized protein
MNLESLSVEAGDVIPGQLQTKSSIFPAGKVWMRMNLSALPVAAESGVADFSDLLMIQGLGPRTLRSLALVSEVIYGKPCRFDDPARFSFAHGGKDGHPFPVPLKVYDETLQYLGRSVSRSRVDESKKRDSLKRLHQLQLRVESLEKIEADPEKVMAWDRQHSAEFDGRTIAGPIRASRSNSRPQSGKKENNPQLELF